MVDKTRAKDFNEKKTVSVVAAVFDHTMADGTAQYDLFNLPGRCLITNAYAICEANGQATLTVDLGFDGGAELIDNADLDGTPGVVKDALSLPLRTVAGKRITAKFSADPTAGKFVFIVHYIEYTLGNGKLLNYSA